VGTGLKNGVLKRIGKETSFGIGPSLEGEKLERAIRIRENRGTVRRTANGTI